MIRFFISSTFRALQTERDYIQTRVYPIIHQYGLERGVYIDVCDLRWGINEESITEIMKVCFSEIDDCKPYIVAIIGDYYGTVPDPNAMIELWKAMGRSEYDLPKNTNISLTQWELEYAFLSKVNPDLKSLCLFKDEANSNSDEAITALKRRIRNFEEENKSLITCKAYCGIDEFENAFIDYAKRTIDEEAASNLNENWVSKELKYARALSKEKSIEFAGRNEYINTFKNAFVQSNEKSVLALYGESGIGKSSLIARLFQITDQSNDIKSEIILCGTSQRNSNYLSVLIEIIYVLERELFHEEQTVKDDKFYSEEIAEQYLKKILYDFKYHDAKLIIFVDAMDKLQNFDSNDIIKIFNDCSSVNVKLVCSQISDFNVSSLSRVLKRQIRRLTRDDISNILKHKLSASNANESKIDSSIVDAISGKKDASSPLYLKIVISILKMHLSDKRNDQKPNNESSTNIRIAHRISIVNSLPGDLHDICWFAFEEAMSYVFDEHTNDKRLSMEKALGLIATSNYGLSDIDLNTILMGEAWTQLDFSALRSFLYDFFVYSYDGGWKPAHDILKESVLEHVSQVCVPSTILFDYVFSDKCISHLEMEVKEGLYLSYCHNDIERAITLFKELGGIPSSLRIDEDDLSGCEEVGVYPSLQIREIASKELNRVLSMDTGKAWFVELIKENTVAVMAMLCGLLEMRKTDDYSRRIPAMHAAELLWDFLGIKTRDDLTKWERGKSFFERQQMASFCSEYIGIYTDYGDRIYATVYSYYPRDFYLNEEGKNLIRLSKEQQRRAFRQVGMLFNANNTVLSYLYKYSNALIEWVNQLPKELRDNDDCHEASKIFERNMAQYYSAIGDIGASLIYRLKALGSDVDEFFSIIGSGFDNYRKMLSGAYPLYESIDAIAIENSNSLLVFDYSHHPDIWSGIIDKIEHSILEEYDIVLVSEKLKAIASGYFVACYDVGKFSNSVPEYERCLDFGLDCSEVAIRLYSSQIASNRKELLSSYYRRLQLYSKKKTLLPDDINEVKKCGLQAVAEYKQQSRFLGFQTGKIIFEVLSNFHYEFGPEWEKAKNQLYQELYGDT